MKKALITGSNGFVGQVLRKELENNGYYVCGVDLVPGDGTEHCDVLDCAQLEAVLSDCRPDVIFHLAGQASVAKSWMIPQKTFEINVIAAINLLEGVKKQCKTASVLLVGSADIYEGGEERLRSPYAVSKKAQEDMAQLYVYAGLDIRMTRSYNHSGAGQKLGFIIPDFCHQIAQIERGERNVMNVGNLSSMRDFSHVKDVATAYRLIIERGVSGEIYNVGSGETHCGQDILDHLFTMTPAPIQVRQDAGLLRAADQSVFACDNRKLVGLGWQPRYTFDDILSDCLEYYRTTQTGEYE